MSRHRRRAALLLLAGLIGGGTAWKWSARREPGPFAGAPQLVAQGEGLIHGLHHGPRNALRAMPMKATAYALAVHHPGPLGPRGWTAAAAAGSAVLLLCLGALLGCAPGGAVAAVAVVLANWLLGSEDSGFLMALTACLLAWRARRPGAARTLLLALGLGATMMHRSSLLLFPPLLAGYELLRAPGGRRQWGQAALLCAAPYAVLLPWTLWNLRVLGELAWFERGMADCNIVTGVLGLAPTVEPGWRDLPGAPAAGVSVARWAAERILAEPAAYAASCLRRLALAVSFEPLLAAFAACALWLRRRSEPCRQLGLLAGYFFLVHSLMSVQQRYFDPLWPVLAVLAACAARPARWRLPGAAAPAGRLALAGLAALAPLYAFTAFVLLFPSRPASAAADAWLLGRRGQERLRAGDGPGAVSLLGVAVRLRPHDQSLLAAHAAALLASGRDAAVLRLRADDPRDCVPLLLRGLRAWRLGDAPGARAEMAAARERWTKSRVMVWRQETALERSTRAALLASACRPFSIEAGSALADLGASEAERRALLADCR